MIKPAPSPFNGGHVVIELPKPLRAMAREELLALKKTITAVLSVEKDMLKPEGFNIYITQGEIHIIPRWCGDVNVAFFGGIKPVPLSNEDVWKIIEKIHEFNS